jgi:cyclase
MAFKKRLVASILVKNGIAVQSFAYNNYLPLGNPVILAENLDRWGVDEIIILSIDTTRNGNDPDLGLLSEISKRVNTPIAYGGGIKNLKNVLDVIHSGADRIIIDQLYTHDRSQIKMISESIGSQAVIIALPCSVSNGKVFHYNYFSKKSEAVDFNSLPFMKEYVASEFLLIDHMNEGKPNSFSEGMIQHFPKDISLICFGGISQAQQVERLFQNPNVVGVCIGNFLNYQEHYFQNIKLELSSSLLRNPVFESCKF